MTRKLQVHSRRPMPMTQIEEAALGRHGCEVEAHELPGDWRFQSSGQKRSGCGRLGETYAEAVGL